MLIKRPADIKSSDITPESTYINRRKFIGRSAAFGAIAAAGAAAPWAVRASPGRGDEDVQDEPLTSYEHVTTYNNFYEFGTGKDDPA